MRASKRTGWEVRVDRDWALRLPAMIARRAGDEDAAALVIPGEEGAIAALVFDVDDADLAHLKNVGRSAHLVELAGRDVTIPRSARRDFGLGPGTRLRLVGSGWQYNLFR